MNILIIDDDLKGTSDLMKVIKNMEGEWNVTSTTDGFQGIIMARKQHGVVFCSVDCYAPKGLDIIKKLVDKENESGYVFNGRIIATSHHNHNGTEEKVKDSGAKALVYKPFNKKEIKKVLEE